MPRTRRCVSTLMSMPARRSVAATGLIFLTVTLEYLQRTAATRSASAVAATVSAAACRAGAVDGNNGRLRSFAQICAVLDAARAVKDAAERSCLTTG